MSRDLRAAKCVFVFQIGFSARRDIAQCNGAKVRVVGGKRVSACAWHSYQDSSRDGRRGIDGSDLVDQQRCSGLPSRLAFLVRRWTPTRASPCRGNRGRDRRDIAERCVKYRPNRSHGQFSVKWLVANVEPSRRPSRPNQTLKNATANGKAFRSRHPIRRSHPPTHLRQGRTRRRSRSVSPVPFR